MSIIDDIRAGKYENKVPYVRGDAAAYRKETGRLNDMFMGDLLAECGVTDHPKASTAFRLAYEFGHSAGYEEVASYFFQLVELLKP